MSGDIPERIKKGIYVTYNGEPKKIEEYAFSSDPKGLSNSDVFNVYFEDGTIVSGGDIRNIKAIDYDNIPPILQVGALVAVEIDGVRDVRRVNSVACRPKTLEEAQCPTEASLCVNLSGNELRYSDLKVSQPTHAEKAAYDKEFGGSSRCRQG